MRNHLGFGRVHDYLLSLKTTPDPTFYFGVWSHSPCSADCLPSAACCSPAGGKNKENLLTGAFGGAHDIFASDKLLPVAIWYSKLS